MIVVVSFVVTSAGLIGVGSALHIEEAQLQQTIHSGSDTTAQLCGGNGIPRQPHCSPYAQPIAVFVPGVDRLVVAFGTPASGPIEVVEPAKLTILASIEPNCTITRSSYPGSGVDVYFACFSATNETEILDYNAQSNMIESRVAIPAIVGCTAKLAVDPPAGLFFCQAWKTNLVAIDLAGAGIRWNVSVPGAVWSAPLAFDSVLDGVVVADGFNQTLHVFSATSGDALLSVNGVGHVALMVFDNRTERLYDWSWAATSSGNFSVFDGRTFHELKRTGFSDTMVGGWDPIVDLAHGDVYFPMYSPSGVVALNLSSGAVVGPALTIYGFDAEAYDPTTDSFYGSDGLSDNLGSFPVYHGLTSPPPFSDFPGVGSLFPWFAGVAVAAAVAAILIQRNRLTREQGPV
ncbi:MAG: hypothetical protein L3K23_02115 [Thermoplasmata archaeon]|nr:hypothetical protein [Thermoplasmata archaeon]